MKKKILVFSNAEKIGDGIIKLPLLYEIKKRLPNYDLVWVTNSGSTVYNKELKNLASQYIDHIIEKVDLNPFFWKKISPTYNFENEYYEYIFDTQKAVYRTLALKRIKCDQFISSTANFLFSSKKFESKQKVNKYYLDGLLNLLDLIKCDRVNSNFKIGSQITQEKKLKKIFSFNKKYIGIAPGAGEKNKIWPLEKFIKVGKYFIEKNYKIVLYLGPEEIRIKDKLIKEFPKAIFAEDIIQGYSNIEIVIGSTKFLTCALANDSGISHMLSTKHCPLIKLFGPKDSFKFTPINTYIKTISSTEFNSKNVSMIPIERVIGEINKAIN